MNRSSSELGWGFALFYGAIVVVGAGVTMLAAGMGVPAVASVGAGLVTVGWMLWSDLHWSPRKERT